MKTLGTILRWTMALLVVVVIGAAGPLAWGLAGSAAGTVLGLDNEEDDDLE